MLVARIIASKKMPMQGASGAHEKEAFIAAQPTTPKTNEEINSVKQVSEKQSFSGYFLPDRLTRLPTPLTDIDLNATEIDEVALEGEIELTLLIDADGTVTDILTSVDQDNARIFADRVAARFQNARYSPGEINGTAVRSQLRIKIVSEPRVEPAAKNINTDNTILER